MNGSVMGALSTVICGLCFCALIWDEMKHREANRKAMKAQATRQLDDEVKAAHRECRERDAWFVSQNRTMREWHKSLWRRTMLEGLEISRQRRFRLEWDGQVGAA